MGVEKAGSGSVRDVTFTLAFSALKPASIFCPHLLYQNPHRSDGGPFAGDVLPPQTVRSGWLAHSLVLKRSDLIGARARRLGADFVLQWDRSLARNAQLGMIIEPWEGASQSAYLECACIQCMEI